MECFVCGREMQKYFVKKFDGVFPEGEFVKCPNCGLVVNQTVYEMDEKEWRLLNLENHFYQGADENVVDPRWTQRLETQANILLQLFKEGVFKHNARVVDYGCGDAKLSRYFRKQGEYNGEQILNYDKFMCTEEYLSDWDMQKGNFDVVITCSVFEHLLGKRDVTEIFSYLSPQGIFCLHTLICEMVPADPEWFYLLPPHCTLWTNKAMQIIFKQYGFVGCGYHTGGKMWFFFRDEQQFIRLMERACNFMDEWIFSADFVDYWKQKPYR